MYRDSNKIPKQIERAIEMGLSLRDYALLVTMISNNKPLTRQEMEELTGFDASVIIRSTEKLSKLNIIYPDKKPVVGGSKDRAAKYSVKR
jgi:predicted transcriptional regulator